MIVLLIVAILFAFLPYVLYLRNRLFYLPPPPMGSDRLPPISVLIPARNESRSIRAAVEAVQRSEGIEWELIVLDDHSVDDTRAIVEAISRTDSRVRVETAPPLPEGWCGKQHACYQLSKLARFDQFAFLDADVRVAPDALARMVRFLHDSKSDLVSGFPKQETGTWLEKLLIPLIHFVLLGFLPLERMRKSLQPSLGAGCGQFFVAKRAAYERIDGHASVKSSLHDGVKLPRAFRAGGFRTDLCDVTDLATCRMYRSAGEVWSGLAKNAREGLGAPRLLPFITLLLLGGQILPFVLLPWVLASETDAVQITLAVWAVVMAWYPRWHAVFRFRQSPLGALLHPLGILLLLSVQWYANFRAWIGKPAGWKGRSYAAKG